MNLREWDGEKESYVPPHQFQKTKEARVDLENFCTQDRLARILNKVESSDKLLQKMKGNVSSLKQIVTSHSIYNKHLETQIRQISTYIKQGQKAVD